MRRLSAQRPSLHPASPCHLPTEPQGRWGEVARLSWHIPTARLEGPAHPPAQADRARRPAGGSPGLSSACLPRRLIAACPRCDVSPRRQLRRGALGGAHPEPVPAQPAARSAPSLIGKPSISLQRSSLPRCHRWAPSGVTGLPLGASGRGLCACLSEGFLGLVGASSDRALLSWGWESLGKS